MIVRKIIPRDDMNYINGWWASHGWNPVHPFMLSSDGYIAETSGKRVAAAWYGNVSNSKTALIEWIVRNPKADKEETYNGLNLIRDEIEKRAIDDGFKILVTLIEHKNLKEWLTDSSFDTYLKLLK